jgi:anthranilate synthase/aminodeoxychorismate synthase-like glutamine amidotransferase
VILLIDNFDSFVFNLARYFERLGHSTRVVRNDAIDAATVRDHSPDAIVLSPGPCTPQQTGNSIELVRALHRKIPILGVCLGHQTIAEAFGGKTIRAAEPVHGRASLINHDGSGVFAGIPSPLSVGRYHSLVVEESSLPAELHVAARTEDGTIMALAHREFPTIGLQFHPESILTEHGYELLANFLRIGEVAVADAVPGRGDEWVGGN